MIQELFKSLVLTDYAKIAHMETVEYLKNLGFNCQTEYRVPDRGDGMGGRIDIIAVKGDLKLAIEVDRAAPREKSIYKLKMLPDEYIRCIICRKVSKYRKFEDFHLIYPIFLNACPDGIRRTWVKKPKKNRLIK